MKKLLLTGLVAATLVISSTVAFAGGKVGFYYAPETNSKDYADNNKDTDTITTYWKLDGSYDVSKELSVSGFFQMGDDKTKTGSSDAVKTGEKTYFGAEAAYAVSKDLKLTPFFNDRIEKYVSGSDVKDKGSRLRYGVKYKYSIDKVTLSGQLRKTSYEYDNAYVTEKKWSDTTKDLNNKVSSPLRFDIEASYPIIESKEFGKMEALVSYLNEKAEYDSSNRKNYSGFGAGIKGSCPIAKLNTSYKITYSPYEYKENTLDFDRNEWYYTVTAEYPIDKTYSVKAFYEGYSTKYDCKTNSAKTYDYSENNFYVGVGMKF